MNSSSSQPELPLAGFSPAGVRPSTGPLDWPLRPLPADTARELQRLSSRWSRRTRRVGAGRIHHEQPV